MRISNSEIQTWKRCRRKWWLAHYRQLRKRRNLDAPRRPLQVGDLVHRALEFYYTPEHYKNVEAGDVLNELKNMVDQEVLLNPTFVEDIQANGDYARVMLEGYFDWLEEEGGDAHLEIVAPEQTVQTILKLPQRDVTFMGKLDVRVHNHEINARQFIETKTVGSFDQFIATSHLNEQLFTYHLLEYLDTLNDENATHSDGVILNMIRRVKRTSTAKPPFYKRKTIHKNKDELRAFYKRTWEVVADISRARTELDLTSDDAHPVKMYPTVDGSCTWGCDFFLVCPLFNEENTARAEAMIAEQFEVHNTYERYEKR